MGPSLHERAPLLSPTRWFVYLTLRGPCHVSHTAMLRMILSPRRTVPALAHIGGAGAQGLLPCDVRTPGRRPRGQCLGLCEWVRPRGQVHKPQSEDGQRVKGGRSLVAAKVPGSPVKESGGRIPTLSRRPDMTARPNSPRTVGRTARSFGTCFRDEDAAETACGVGHE